MASISLKGNKLDIIFKDGTTYSTGITATPENVSAQVKKAIDAAQGEYILDSKKLAELDALATNSQNESNRITAQLKKPAAVEKKAAPKAATPTPAAPPRDTTAKKAAAPVATPVEAPKTKARVGLENNEIVIVFSDTTRVKSGVMVDPNKPGEVALRIGQAKSAVSGKVDINRRGELDRIDVGAAISNVKERLATMKAAAKQFEQTIGQKAAPVAQPAPKAAAPPREAPRPTEIPAPKPAPAPKDTVPKEAAAPKVVQPPAAQTALTGVTPKPALLPGTVMTPTVTQNWLDNQFQRGAVDSIFINRAAVDGMLRQNANNQKAATVTVFNSLARVKRPGEEEGPLSTYLSMKPALSGFQETIGRNGGVLTAGAASDTNVVKAADMFIRDFLLNPASRDSTYRRELLQVDGMNTRLGNVEKWKAAAKADPTAKALMSQQFVGPMDAATMAAAGLYLRRSANPSAPVWKAPVAQVQPPQTQPMQQPVQPAAQKAPAQPPQKVAEQPAAKPAPKPEPKREIVW